jgi:hypothetical protein
VSMVGRTISPHDNGRDRGRGTAVLYSLTGNCKPLEVDPFAYLRDVLRRVPQTRSTNCYLMSGSPRTLRRGARRPPEVSRWCGQGDSTMRRDRRDGTGVRPGLSTTAIPSARGAGRGRGRNAVALTRRWAACRFFFPVPVTGGGRRAITSV